ncbi:MAG: type II CAAX endopeptidase family protein [Lachnospiraceae bacterium]|nr:type II CAAX endopeptidase family protein [Lachnospiraceae bacterium]MDD3617133.1 type II CAAX endopeptidase family protein [Lachnospiraceae bacterium]
MKFTEIQKKQLIIYVLVTFGFTFLMGAVMAYGYFQGIDVSTFPNAQMFYPAAGAMLAILITRKGDEKIPKRFFIMFIALTTVMAVICIASIIVFMPTTWALAIQLVIIAGSVLGWIFMLTEKKEKREAYGLRMKNWKKSAFCVVLFLFIYLLRTAISYGMSGQIQVMESIFTDATTWMLIVSLPVNFFIVFTAFFGEEYGWRYYLQPLFQQRFGLRGGVLVLGVVWGLWHMPVNFFYYSPGSGLASMAGQQITCITLGIFFAYAYMKTQNIWVPVILHYLNNNMVPIVTGSYGANVLQNNQVTWSALLPSLLINGLLFGIFIFAKEFRKRTEAAH